MIKSRTKTGVAGVDKVVDEFRDEVRAAFGKVVPIRVLTWGANDLGTTTAERYLYPGFDANIAFTAERGAHIVTTAGRLRNVYAWHHNAGTGAADITYVIRVNGKDTPITVSLPNTSLGVFTARAKAEVPVKAGDIVTCAVRKSAAIAASTTTAIVALELV